MMAMAELRQHAGHLALAGPAEEDDAEHGEQDRRDLAGEERDDALGVDVLRRGRRTGRSLHRVRHERVHDMTQR